MLVNIGEAVGVIAAQSIGEPGTQLTMRTFHIGGAASRAAAVDNVKVKTTGNLKFNNIKTVRPQRRPPGGGVAFGRDVRHGRPWPRARTLQGALRRHRSRSRTATAVKSGQVVANWDPHTHPIVTEVAGVIRFNDFIDGVTVQRAGRRDHRPAVGWW